MKKIGVGNLCRTCVSRMLLLCVLLSFQCGCGQLEIENRAFPLALAIQPGKEKGMYDFSFFFEETGSAGSGLYYREDTVVEAEGYPQAFTMFGRAQAAQLDDSHMQAILMSEELLKDKEFLASFYQYFIKEHHFSWNTMVYLTDKNSLEISKLSKAAGGHPGMYLRDIAESDEQEKTASVPTLGDLYKEWNNHEKIMLLPVLGGKKPPTVDHYRVLVYGELSEKYTLDEARLLQLLKGDLNKLQVSLKDETVVRLEGVFLWPEQEQNTDKWTVTLHARCIAENRTTLSEEAQLRVRNECEEVLMQRLERVRAYAPIKMSDGSYEIPNYKIKLNWME